MAKFVIISTKPANDSPLYTQYDVLLFLNTGDILDDQSILVHNKDDANIVIQQWADSYETAIVQVKQEQEQRDSIIYQAIETEKGKEVADEYKLKKEGKSIAQEEASIDGNDKG